MCSCKTECETCNCYYVIYGKEIGKKMFRPVDLKNGRFVKNLIYASMFNVKEHSKAVEVLNDLNTNNKDLTFELRKFG